MRITNTSERLKELLSSRDVKQIDIIESTGITKGALSSYISGRYEPKQDKIFLLARYFGVSEAWLMGYDVPMEKPAATSFEDKQRERILAYYDAFNNLGKDELLRYMKYLSSQNEYKKDSDESTN